MRRVVGIRSDNRTGQAFSHTVRPEALTNEFLVVLD